MVDQSKLLKDLVASMEAYLEKETNCSECCRDEAKDCDEEENDMDESEEICEALQKTYDDFIKWALGKVENMTHKDAVKAWKKLHPEEDLPRVFYLKNLWSFGVILYLILDTYPIYLKEKGDW
jgi:hypothetical protein